MKRYDFDAQRGIMMVEKDGFWISHDDYLASERERERVRTDTPAADDALTDAEIIEIRDEHLPSQGEQFDCLAFARAVIRAANDTTYAHMCRMDHVEIGHNDSEHELCPLCRMQNERDALAERAERLHKALRNCYCPRPANNRPDGFTIGECVDADECGCIDGEHAGLIK